MKSFWKHVLASTIGSLFGLIVASVLVGIISIAIITGIIASATSEKETRVKNNSIIEIKLENPIIERTSNNPFDGFSPMSMDIKQSIGLDDILKNLHKAQTDDKIKGIFLNLSSVPSGIASIEEVRDALVSFKDSSGKFIIAYGNVYSQGAYYLATAADKIYLNPAGFLDYRGLSAEIMFFTKALEKIGVEPQIIRGRNNKFKSAVEPFMYTEMSDANREQTETYMGSMWDHMLAKISNARGISVEDLTIYADSMKIENAQAALDFKMIDGIKYKDEVIDELKELAGIKAEKDLKIVSLSAYTKAPKKKEKEKGYKREKIAIVYANGQIMMGEGDAQTIGSETLSEAIREARLDSNIKAIVLRINSPGGDAIASEVIWREVELAKEVKPVIVSMGNYAASGGYYIACPADVIVSNPVTLTGSIGVFGVLWNGQELLNDKLGVTVDNVKTSAHADMGSMFRPLTASEKVLIQKSVENVYSVFVNHVAEGRNITNEYVDSIGQGRVWSGVNAKEIGLVDEIGGLQRALEIAAEKAELDDYRLVSLPKQEDPFEQIVKEMMGNTELSFMKKHLGDSYVYYNHLNNALRIKGVQAILPYGVEIY